MINEDFISGIVYVYILSTFCKNIEDGSYTVESERLRVDLSGNHLYVFVW